MGEQEGDRVAALAAPTIDRLVEIKRRYDPENVLNLEEKTGNGGSTRSP
jgi:Berberine and berberine like